MDTTGKVEIADMWKNHFKNLLNCVKGGDSDNICSDMGFDQNAVINPGEIEGKARFRPPLV